MAEVKEAPKTNSRLVAGVFAGYQTFTRTVTGDFVPVTATGWRGESIDLVESEEQRLDALGMLAPPGTSPEQLDAALVARKEDVAAAIARGLAPTDVPALFAGPPVTVSPPGLGAPPIPGPGALTEGDTGAPDNERKEAGAVLSAAATAQTDEAGAITSVAVPAPATTPAPSESPAASYDARGKSVEELVQWLGDEKPNAGATVAAAGDDPDTAARLIEAEESASQGDPRSTVIGPLTRIADGGEERNGEPNATVSGPGGQ